MKDFFVVILIIIGAFLVLKAEGATAQNLGCFKLDGSSECFAGDIDCGNGWEEVKEYADYYGHKSGFAYLESRFGTTAATTCGYLLSCEDDADEQFNKAQHYKRRYKKTFKKLKSCRR